MAYRLTRRARRDVLDIWRHIAADSESVADRFVDRLTHHFQILGDVPYAGRPRDDIRTGYRSFPIGDYLIFYRLREPGIQIMHVVHGRRDLTRYPF
jgi:toxin ParE1/3/4